MTNPESTDQPTQPEQAPREPAKPEPPAKSFTQAELDAIVADRLARDRAARERKFADYDELKRKAADYDGLLRDTESETEKRVREAREEGERSALGNLRPRLVLAEMRAAAAGRVDGERFDTLTEDLDLSKYLTDDGEVDMAKVRRKVDAWAPPAPAGEPEQAQPEPKGPRRPKPDPTQGAGRARAGDVDRGIEEARRRFGDRAVGLAASNSK